MIDKHNKGKRSLQEINRAQRALKQMLREEGQAKVHQRVKGALYMLNYMFGGMSEEDLIRLLKG